MGREHYYTWEAHEHDGEVFLVALDRDEHDDGQDPTQYSATFVHVPDGFDTKVDTEYGNSPAKIFVKRNGSEDWQQLRGGVQVHSSEVMPGQRSTATTTTYVLVRDAEGSLCAEKTSADESSGAICTFEVRAAKADDE